MRKSIRDKALKSLANTTQGEALLDLLEEEMKRMTDIANIEGEIDLRGKQKAVEVLRNIFRILEKKKQPKQKTEKTDYT